jgi:hypothetical protein
MVDMYECINADANIAISADLYAYSYTARFPLDAFRYLAISIVHFCMLLAMPR